MADWAVLAFVVGFIGIVVWVALRHEGRRRLAARVLRTPLAMTGAAGVFGVLGSSALLQGQVMGLLLALLASSFIASVIYAATAPIAGHPARRDRR